MEKLVTSRYIIAVVAIQGWHLAQLDVNNASLNGDFDEEIFMNLRSYLRSKKDTRYINSTHLCLVQAT